MAYKANVGKRVGAAFIDLLLGAVVGLFFLILKMWPASVLLTAAYLLVRDGLGVSALANQSVGKRLSRLHVEMRDTGNEKLTLPTSVKRNLPLAAGLLLATLLGLFGIPLLIALVIAAAPPVAELVLVLRDPEGLRYGDKLAGTKVLD